MSTRSRSIGLLVLALPALTQGASATDGTLWRRALDAPSSQRIDLERADILPQGGYRLTGNTRDISDIVQDFDAEDQPLGPPRFGPTLRFRSRGAAEPTIALSLEWTPVTFDLRQIPPLPCQRRDLGQDREHRRIDDLYRIQSYRSGGLDGEDGGFAANYNLSPPFNIVHRLYRHQADCSLEAIADVEFAIVQLSNSSREAMAFARTADSSHLGAPPTLLRAFDRQGLRWTQTLQIKGEDLPHLGLLQEWQGDAVVGAGGDSHAALFRIGPDGSQRWARAFEGPAQFDSATPYPQGVLITGRAGATQGQPLSAITVWMIDPEDGRVIWSYSDAQARYVAPVPAATQHTAVLLRLDDQGSESRLIELNEKGEARLLRRVPDELNLLLQLPDERILASHGSGLSFSDGINEPGRRLVRLEPHDGPVPEGEALVLPWPEQPVAHAFVDGDSVIATRQDDRYAVHSITSEGETRWRVLLPPRVFYASLVYPPYAEVLHSEHFVCLSLRRESYPPSPPELSLSCLRRNTGEVLFAYRDLNTDAIARAYPMRLFEHEGQPALLLYSSPRCDGATTCPRRLERIDLAAEEISRRAIFEVSSARPTLYLGELNAQESLITRRDDAQALLQLLALDFNGNQRELTSLSISVADDHPIAFSTHAGVLVLQSATDGRSSRALWLRPDGRLRGSTTLPGRYDLQLGWLSQTAAAHDSQGAALITVLDDQLLLHRLDAQAQPRWQQRIGSLAPRPVTASIPRPELDVPLGLHLNADGQLTLALQRGERLLLRRFDADSGREVSAQIEPLDGRAYGGAGWEADGDLRLLNRGAQHFDSPPRPAQLIKMRLADATGCDHPLPAGFWFDPGSNGQGLFFHPVSDGQLMTGVWLTFAPNGTTDRADLRWFSLNGEVRPEQSDIVLALQSARDGRFADSSAANSETVGEVRLKRLRCDLLAFEYRFESGELAGHSGSIHLVPGAATSSTPAGIWFSPQFDGQGLLLQQLDQEPARLLGAWATFDPATGIDDASAQHWFTLDGAQGADGVWRAQIIRSIGGSFAALPTDNHLQVGEAELDFVACDRLRLSYRFAAGGAAAEFAGLNGQMALQRLDGCQTPR